MEPFDSNKSNMETVEKIWEECEPKLRRLCMYKLEGHPDLVDDVISEVFLMFCKAVNKGICISKPYAWLLSTANNIIKEKHIEMALNKKRTISLDDIQFQLSYEMNLDLNPFSDEQIENAVREIHSRLSVDELELLNLTTKENMRIKDIAKQFGTTDLAIKQKLYRLKSKIKALSQEIFEEQK